MCVIAVCLVFMVVYPKSWRDESLISQAANTTVSGDKFSQKTSLTRMPTFAKPTHAVGTSPTNTTPAPVEIYLNQIDVTTTNVTVVIPAFVGRAATNPVASPAVINPATITGRVTLRGTPPAETNIEMPELSPCALLQTNTHTTHLFSVGNENGLADVLVTIQRIRGGGFSIPRPGSGTQKISFLNCEIRPPISVITQYDQVVFENADNVMHTPRITSTNRPPRTSLSLSLPAMASRQVVGIIPTEVFMPITCDEHPWEKAFLSRVPHAIFALTDADGNYAITNMPPGKYLIRALHRGVASTNGLIREVTVGKSEIVPVNFVMDAPGK